MRSNMEVSSIGNVERTLEHNTRSPQTAFPTPVLQSAVSPALAPDLSLVYDLELLM